MNHTDQIGNANGKNKGYLWLCFPKTKHYADNCQLILNLSMILEVAQKEQDFNQKCLPLISLNHSGMHNEVSFLVTIIFLIWHP